MTHYYRLLAAPSSLDEMVACLGGLRYNDQILYASFRTQERECGRPISSLRKPRWFEKKHCPDQQWLPFEEFTPVRMYPPMHLLNNRWQCKFAVNEGEIYQTSLSTNSHRPGPNTLLALEVYERLPMEHPLHFFDWNISTPASISRIRQMQVTPLSGDIFS